MKLASIALGVSLLVSPSAFAVSPIAPPPPETMVGMVRYTGAGLRDEAVEFGDRLVTHVRLRIPAHCALTVSPIAFVGPNGVAPGNLVTAYNDGLYSHFLYAVNGGWGAELNGVEMGISSPFQYTRAHQCGVRVWVR